MRIVLEKVVEKIVVIFVVKFVQGEQVTDVKEKCYNIVTFILDIGHCHMFSWKVNLFCLQL
jgi:hypothetical protein